MTFKKTLDTRFREYDGPGGKHSFCWGNRVIAINVVIVLRTFSNLLEGGSHAVLLLVDVSDSRCGCHLFHSEFSGTSYYNKISHLEI
jgi:hypothetical protein